MANEIKEQINWKNKVAKAIFIMGAIRYIPISTEDGFFVLKFPGRNLLPREKISNETDYFQFSRSNYFQTEEDAEVWADYPYIRKPMNFCYVFHNNILSERWGDSHLSGNGLIEEYLDNYCNEYLEAPEFWLNTMFAVKLIDSKELPDFTFVLDFLIPRKDVKISSQVYWKHISKLLKDVGLLEEKRGKVKSVDATTKILQEFVLNEFKSIKKKKPLPVKLLQKRLEAEVNRLFPDDAKKAQKYYWSDTTIRRIIE